VRQFAPVFIVVLGALLLACTQAPRTGSAPQTSGGTQTSASSEWDQIVAAAKREGKVVVVGPQGSDARDALVEGFQQKYPDIEVDYSGLSGSEVAPKLINEQAANQHLTDLAITGTTTVIEALRPADAVVPIKDYLVGPNVRDTSVWRDGKLNFADDAGQYNLVFSAYVKEAFVYNPTMIAPGEITSYRDLLDSKWRGKIVFRNPTTPGGGLAAATFFYATDSLGKDFLGQLLKQDVVISTDDRQVLDWVARGQYPIAFGPSNVLTNEYIERGLPVKLMSGDNIQEGSYLTAGNGTLAVLRDVPHPNALKVYLDWLLSKDGQADWTREIGFASLRRDVPHPNVDPILVPQEGVEYQANHMESYVKMRSEIVAFIKSVLPQ